MFNSKDTLFGKKDEGIKDNKLSTLPRAPAAAASHAAVIAAAPAPGLSSALTLNSKALKSPTAIRWSWKVASKPRWTAA